MNTSDKWQTACLLALSGGLQDAYSFFLRGHVFANAQTGNVVLLSRDLVSLNAPSAIRYLIPLCAFAFGILMAEIIRTQGSKRLPCVHWQQLVLWTEAILLFLAGFLPASQNHIANALISFSCAMQVQSFRTLNHKSYASTMCIGNLRSFVEHLFLAAHSHSKTDLLHALSLLAIITLFALGATFGFLLSKPLHLYSIWTSSALLLLASASIPSQKH